jgi:hypothetical protein
MLIFLTDNGGPPGVLYEFLVASFYYCFIAASLAEVCFRSYTKSLRVLIHSPDGFGRALLRRCLSLGYLNPGPKTRSAARILHRVYQLLWVALRPSFHRIHHVRARGTDVWPVPPKLCHPTMAYLHHSSFDHMDLYRLHRILQQIPSLPPTIRTIRCNRWRYSDNHCRRSDAKNPFYKRFRLVRVG